MVAVPPTSSLLAPPPTNVGRRHRGGGGGDGPEQHPHGAEMPTVEIRCGVNFPCGEYSSGNDNGVAAAAALADADAADSGNCTICEGGQDGGGAGEHHDAHCVRSVLLRLRCVWNHSCQCGILFLPAGKSPLQESYYSYDQSYIL